MSTNVFAVKKRTKIDCEPGRHWVRAHFRRGYSKSDGTKVSASYVSAHCHDNPKGYEFWKDKFRNGLPKNWPTKNEKSKPWTDEEHERTLEALAEIPEILWPRQVNGIYRGDIPRFHGNTGSAGKGHIVVYTNAFSENEKLARILSHELAHLIFEEIDDELKVGFLSEADWSGTAKGKWSPGNRKFLKPDSKLSPSEDFANSVEYYMFDPHTLRQVSPKVYNWILKIYGDKLKIGKAALK